VTQRHPRGPRMGSLVSPCRTSYWSSTETVALTCSVFEKTAFCIRVSGDRQTNSRTDKQGSLINFAAVWIDQIEFSNKHYSSDMYGVKACNNGCLFTNAPTSNPLIPTSKPQSNRPLYSNTVIGTLAVDGWAVTFGTARRGLGALGRRPGPSSLYQM